MATKIQIASRGPSTRFLDDIDDEDDDDEDRSSRSVTDDEDDESDDSAPASDRPRLSALAGAPSPRTTLIPTTQHSPARPRATKKEPTMPPATTDAIRLRILNAWSRLSKGGRIPGYAEIVKEADVPGANEDAKRQRVGAVLRGAGLGPGSRGSEKRKAATAEAEAALPPAFRRTEAARPAGRRTATPPPSTPAAERAARKVAPEPAARARRAFPADGTLAGLRRDREAAIQAMTDAALRVSALTLAIAACGGEE